MTALDRSAGGWGPFTAGELTLRPFTGADVAWVFQVSAHDPVMHRFVNLPAPYQMGHAEHFVRRAITGWESRQRAEFVVEHTGQRVGRVALGLRPEVHTAEIGYWVPAQHRRRGIATRAVRTVCRWGFDVLDIDLITWHAEAGNTASRTVAERAGFLVEATLRKRLIHQGERMDAWVGSLLPQELSDGDGVLPHLAARSARDPRTP
ncbi:GNAT family N-acetyltransferase [Actinomadura rudentiformis]|uniref:GNAT family N-acetyltransferase n=1 Tax=Actinomadura rudentiformis TaxID=359158 RepID=A0A6H9Z7F9_9ACTN|nr:GNAT family protein [Actinomadura rudentiformis]KAB2349735.1 GNAT family N-acetyltransferase [Actinomadura rudentiformis]